MPIKAKHKKPVVRSKHSNRWLYEMVAAWIVLIVVGTIVNMIALAPAWRQLADNGWLRPASTMTSALIAWIALTGIVAYVTISLLARVEKHKKVLLAFLMGILVSVPSITEYFFLNIPSSVMAFTLLGNLVAFGIIGWILAKKA